MPVDEGIGSGSKQLIDFATEFLTHGSSLAFLAVQLSDLYIVSCELPRYELTFTGSNPCFDSNFLLFVN